MTTKTLVASEIERGPIRGPDTLTFQKTLRGGKGRPVGKRVEADRKMHEDFEVVGPDKAVIVSGKAGDWLVITGRVGYSFPGSGRMGSGPFGLNVTPLRMSYSVISKESNPERYAELEGLRNRSKSAMRD